MTRTAVADARKLRLENQFKLNWELYFCGLPLNYTYQFKAFHKGTVPSYTLQEHYCCQEKIFYLWFRKTLKLHTSRVHKDYLRRCPD